MIIGGGVSGMTSALILAKQGFGVALVEKSRQLAHDLRIHSIAWLRHPSQA